MIQGGFMLLLKEFETTAKVIDRAGCYNLIKLDKVIEKITVETPDYLKYAIHVYKFAEGEHEKIEADKFYLECVFMILKEANLQPPINKIPQK